MKKLWGEAVQEVLAFLQSFHNYCPGGGFFSEEGGRIALEVQEVRNASRFREGMARAKEILKGEKEFRGTLLLLWDREGRYRLGYLERVALWTGRERFLGRTALYLPGKRNGVLKEGLGLLKEWWSRGEPLTLEALREAFSPERVAQGFYREMERAFRELAPEVRGLEGKGVQEFLLTLVARVLFLAFVAKRGWLGGREDFLPWLLERYRAEGLWGKGRFYSEWLSPLFFAALKGPPGRKGTGFDHLPQEVREAYLEAPYLGELSPKPGIDEPGTFLSDEGVERILTSSSPTLSRWRRARPTRLTSSPVRSF